MSNLIVVIAKGIQSPTAMRKRNFEQMMFERNEKGLLIGNTILIGSNHSEFAGLSYLKSRDYDAYGSDYTINESIERSCDSNINLF